MLSIALAPPAAGVPDDRSFKYVKEFPLQWVMGRVVDNCGAGIENASVVRILDNGDMSVAYTDENGSFAILTPVSENMHYRLIVNENHTGFNDTRPCRGFASCIVENWIDSTGSRYHLVVLDYDPFEVHLSQSSVPLHMGWTRRVGERRYEYRLLNTIHGSKYNVRLVGGRRIYTYDTTTDPFYYRVERVPGGWGWRGDRDYSTGKWVDPSEYLCKYFTAANGSEIGLHHALRNVRYRVERIVYGPYTKVYRAGYWTWGGYRIYYIPGPYYIHFCDYYVGGYNPWIHGLSVPPQTFVITEEESRVLNDIPYYASNGSFVRVDSIDYVLGSVSAEVGLSVVRKNGYTGQVYLSVKENGVSCDLKDNNLSITENSTVLMLTAENNVENGIYAITLQATDSLHLIDEKEIEVTVDAPPKPSPSSVEYILYSPNNEIQVKVFSDYTGPLSGARVVLRFFDGTIFASGYTDSKGIFTCRPSEWPANVNLDVEASYPGYITKHAYLNTGNGGVRYVSVYLNVGSYKLEKYHVGHAIVDQHGNIISNRPGSVRVFVEWPAPTWTGGPVSLSGELISPYYTGYSIEKPSLDPTLNPDVSLVYAYPYRPIGGAAVRVTSRAGAPSYLWDTAEVEYVVKLGSSQ